MKKTTARVPKFSASDLKKMAAKEGARRSLILERLPGYFLLICLSLALLAFLYVLGPFLTVLVIAAVLTIAFYPIYKRILKAFRGRARLASLVSCLLIILVIVIPLTIFVIMIGSEAMSTYNVVYEKINSGVFDKYLQWQSGGFFYDLKEKISPFVDIESLNVKQDIINMAGSLTQFLVEQTKVLLTGVFSVLFDFLIMLFAMYYFFKDGPALVEKIGKISPLPSIYESQLFSKIGSMVKAIIFGVFLTAIAQGVLGGVGFAIAGISNPVFWGAAMAFLSLVPMIGTAVIWVPAVVILTILGSYGAAIFILLWGVLLVSSVDNILRPYLIGGKAHTYPLMTFFVILGAIFTMGIKGVVIGPLILMLLMSFLHIYETEYGKVLKR